MKFKEIHNFFEDPDKIRNIALSQKYGDCQTSVFPGKRSESIDDEDPIYERIIAKILPDVVKYEWTSFELGVFFQYTDKDVICKEHTDIRDPENTKYGFSGVIYLNPELPEGDYGTTVGGTKISNEYNKLVYYDANIIHKPTGTFGNDVNDSRLVIAFFLFLNKKLNLTM